MSLALSIFARECSGRQRGKRFYVYRCGPVLIGAIFVFAGYLMTGATASAATGLRIFMSLLFSALVGVTLMSAMSAASMIFREKEDRTLGLLFMSDVSPTAFIIGKLFTTLFSTMMAILSSIPIFLLAMTLGGISGPQILAGFAILLGMVVFGAAMGLLAGTMAHSERGLAALLVFLALLFFAAFPALVTLPDLIDGLTPPRETLNRISPIFALDGAIRGALLSSSLSNGLLNALLALPVLVITIALLRGKVLNFDQPTFNEKMLEKLHATKFYQVLFHPRPIRGNPIIWKDSQFGHGGPMATTIKLTITILVLGALGGTALFNRTFLINNLSPNVVVYIFYGAVTIVCMLSVLLCAKSFYLEKKTSALDVVLISPLTNQQIIFGKIKATLLRTWPWLVFVTVWGYTMIFPLYNKDYAIMFWLEFLTTWFAYSMFALNMSMLCKRNIAFALALLVFLVWQTLGRAMAMAYMGGNFFAGASIMGDVTFNFVLGSMSLFILRRVLRKGELLDAFLVRAPKRKKPASASVWR